MPSPDNVIDLLRRAKALLAARIAATSSVRTAMALRKAHDHVELAIAWLEAHEAES